MGKLILASPAVLWDSKNERFFPGVAEALQEAQSQGSAIFVLSNWAEPAWVSEAEFLRFQPARGRQSGKIVAGLIEANKKLPLEPSDVVVLGTTNVDLQMAANSQTLLLRTEWTGAVEANIGKYGIPLSDPREIPLVLSILDDKEPWFFSGNAAGYEVYALTDASTLREANATMIQLAETLKSCLKAGAQDLKTGFYLHLLSSLYVTRDFAAADRWSYYPSSSSANDGEEIMHGFCDQARCMFKKRELGPLFIRHQASAKRHQTGGDRTDPTSQLESVHLSPRYRGRLRGKTIVVLDDYLTYGVSFGVAAALLKAAGAERVICVAMGKFGGTARSYDISISASPFEPLEPGDWTVNGSVSLVGTRNDSAKQSFLSKFEDHLQ